MADGFAQGTKKPVLVNLHSGAGTGNGMCNIMTAFQNKTPLIITAGQQTREMILGDPYLTNRDETLLPRPWVKWAYQPVRAGRSWRNHRAYTTAVQPPAGPVYVSFHWMIGTSRRWEKRSFEPSARAAPPILTE